MIEREPERSEEVEVEAEEGVGGEYWRQNPGSMVSEWRGQKYLPSARSHSSQTALTDRGQRRKKRRRKWSGNGNRRIEKEEGIGEGEGGG